MNTETEVEAISRSNQNAAPIFFRLIDSDQEKAERTIKDLMLTAEKLGVGEILQLRNILPHAGDGYVTVFSLNLETGMKYEPAGKALDFMEHVFKNLFHKNPAYTEPEL